MIWGALLIPLIALGVITWKYPKRVNLLEYILVFVVPVACICIGKWASVYTQTRDTEYWNSYAVSAMYEEEWKEQWEEMHTETYTDSKGNTHTRTYWTTERKYYPEQWTIFDNIGEEHSIGKPYFEELCKLWGNRSFKEMNRKRTSRHSMETSHKILIDGDAYVTKYDSNFEHTVPLCTMHTYENRIQASKSVFNFRKVSEATKGQYKLFDYPPENVHHFNPILGYKSKEATQLLRAYNAHNGARRQIHMMLLVFQKQPSEAALFQEAYWKGGNKNEFIVCVGLNSTNIAWTKTISWTDNQILKAKTAREIKEMRTFDPVKVVRYMGENIPKKFVRKQFADFSYISVQPTMTAVIVTYGVTLLATLAVALIAIFNRHDFGTFLHRKRRYRRGFYR